MDSFYGGRPGYSFIIAKSFKSIAEMVENFQKGPEYEAVHFNEYVLINTEDKHDKDNGKIYRRGYDYTNDLGGAQYVGTIVGPSGMAPHVEFATIDEVNAMERHEGIQYRYRNGEWSVDNKSIVPGKYVEGGENKFHDSIKWVSYSVRTPNNDDCTAYIAFEWPYTVIDYTADSKNPYYNRDDEEEHKAGFNNVNLVDRVDEGDHPFYEHWHISVPQGIHGSGFQKLRVVAADDPDETIQPYEGQEEDEEASRMVWVVDYYQYEKEEDGEPITLYLGDFNIIKDINIDSEGNVHITYTHEDQKDIPLIWLIGLDIAEDGTVTLHYTNKDDEVLETKVKWIDNIVVNTDTGEEKEGEGEGDQQIHVTYNTGEEVVIGDPLNYIMATAVTDDFHLLIKHSDPAKRKQIIEEGKNYTGTDENPGYKGDLEWQDMGPIKDEDGILIGLNLSQTDIEDDISSLDGAIEYLNKTYPNGLVEEGMIGKVVTIGYEDRTKLMYAFDYRKINDHYKGWYYLGSLQVDPDFIITIAQEDETEKKNILNTNGIWLEVTENESLVEEGA